MAFGRGVYKAHREQLLQIKELFQPVVIKADSMRQLSSSVNRFMKEESKFILRCHNAQGGFTVVAIKEKE